MGDAVQAKVLLDFFTLRCDLMFPIHQHASIRKHKCNLHRRILNTNTLMRTTSEHEVAFWVGISGAIRLEPAFGDKLVRIGEDLGIVQGVVK